MERPTAHQAWVIHPFLSGKFLDVVGRALAAERLASDPAAATCLLGGLGLPKPAFAHLSPEFLCEAITRQVIGSPRHVPSTHACSLLFPSPFPSQLACRKLGRAGRSLVTGSVGQGHSDRGYRELSVTRWGPLVLHIS